MCPTVICPTVICPTVICPTVMCPIVICPTVICPTVMCPTIICPTVICPTVICPTVICPTATFIQFTSISILFIKLDYEIRKYTIALMSQRSVLNSLLYCQSISLSIASFLSYRCVVWINHLTHDLAFDTFMSVQCKHSVNTSFVSYPIN